MRVRKRDPGLAALPEDVRTAAHALANGEVAWANDFAETAIHALAANGKLILGLDARTLYPDGGVRETPISAWEGDEAEPSDAAVERARQESLEALEYAKSEGTHVLITWS